MAKEMWDVLRGSLLHYLRLDEFTEAVRRRALYNLHQYAAYVQEVGSLWQCWSA